MRTLAALLLAVSPSVMAETQPLPVTRAAVEVFGVALRGNGDGLDFTRQEGPLENGENPYPRARQLVEEGARQIALIHSTSWRWEPDGRIVLTYVCLSTRCARARPRYASSTRSRTAFATSLSYSERAMTARWPGRSALLPPERSRRSSPTWPANCRRIDA
jgi:hypothetical protein